MSEPADSLILSTTQPESRSQIFHCFLDLPPEIRLIIWRFCLPHRIVKFRPRRSRQRRSGTRRIEPRPGPPVISAVSFEARRVAFEYGGFRQLVLNHSLTIPDIARFDTSTDTLCIHDMVSKSQDRHRIQQEAEMLGAIELHLEEAKRVAISGFAIRKYKTLFNSVAELGSWLCTRDEVTWVMGHVKLQVQDFENIMTRSGAREDFEQVQLNYGDVPRIDRWELNSLRQIASAWVEIQVTEMLDLGTAIFGSDDKIQFEDETQPFWYGQVVLHNLDGFRVVWMATASERLCYLGRNYGLPMETETRRIETEG